MEVFSQMEEVHDSLVVPWETVEKAVEGFFREGWVEEPGITMLSEDLVAVVVLMETKEVLEAEVGTLVEAVVKINGTHVQEGEGLTTLEKISKMNVVTTKVAMVR